ncbi:Ras-related small GTP-binding family protein [Striga asiatica]|uniref:Ras-related small GTP-binding family protein n=1 Tax=Striga asiatica TaxID=4170 RepID=A0A5A7QG67_STRAF|nr:Ras-related small GTP-binding family protein [Striga asiatica]
MLWALLAVSLHKLYDNTDLKKAVFIAVHMCSRSYIGEPDDFEVLRLRNSNITIEFTAEQDVRVTIEMVRSILGLVMYQEAAVGTRSMDLEEISKAQEQPFLQKIKSLGNESCNGVVMVAGHSVYTSSRCEKVDEENAWYLQPYQKRLGQAATFVQHIQKGVEIVANDDVALLLFSGGETRKEAGPRSEAQSYYRNSGLLCGVLDMNPQLREIMQNPEILQQLTSPETMKAINIEGPSLDKIIDYHTAKLWLAN